MKKNKFAIILIVVFLGGILFLNFAIFQNVRIISSLIKGFSNTTQPYFFLQNAIYRKAQKHDIIPLIKKYISADSPYLYSRLLGVIGARNSKNDTVVNELIQLYTKYQDDDRVAPVILKSLGVQGDSAVIPLFESVLKNESRYKQHMNAATGLYLLTGQQVELINYHKEKQKLFLYDNLREARNIIVDSDNRKRTYKQMLALDKLYQPPEN